jgi:Tfp pilus assembly protein PilN
MIADQANWLGMIATSNDANNVRRSMDMIGQFRLAVEKENGTIHTNAQRKNGRRRVKFFRAESARISEKPAFQRSRFMNRI